MKLARLELRRFGRFDDAALEFGADPAAAGGVHVVFGPNEAGKSTTLDAIRYTLYGMPTGRSSEPSYDFRFAKKDIRTALALLLDDGSELAFARNRGTKVSVLDPVTGDPDQPRADRLAGVLAGVPKELWQTRHGLNQQTLREGAKALLDGGSTGEALFAAAAGMVGARRVLDEIRSQRQSMLGDSGRSGTLHDAVSALKESTTEFNRARRAAAGFDDADAERASLCERIESTRAEHAAATAELATLERALAARPVVLERARLVAERDAVDGVPEDWSAATQQRFDAAAAIVRGAHPRIAELEVRIADLRTRLDGLRADPVLLAIGDRIDALHQRIGAVDAARDALPQLRSAVRAAEDAHAHALEAVDGIELPTREARAALADIVPRRAALEAAEAASRVALDQARTRTGAVDGAAGPDVDADELARIEAVIAVARRVDEPALVREELRLAESAEVLDAAAARIAPSAPSVEALERLPIPAATVRSEFEAASASLDARVDEAQRVLELATKKLGEHEAELERLVAASGDVPDQATLERLRGERATAWQAVRDVIAAPTLDGGDAVLGRMDVAIDAADAYADRMVAGAERVGTAKALQESIDQDQRRIAAATEQLEAAATERRALDTRWRELWQPAGIEPGSIAAMREFVDRVDLLRERRGAMADRRLEVRSARDALERAITSLGAALGVEFDPGTQLDVALERAERRRDELASRRSERIHAAGSLQQATAAVSDATEALAASQADWEQALVATGLTGTSTCAAATRRLELLDELVAADAAVRTARVRTADTEALVATFAADVEDLLRGLDEATRALIGDHEPAVAVVALRQVVATVTADARSIEALQERLDEATTQLQQLRVEQAGAEAELNDLVDQGGAADVAALTAAADRWRIRAELDEQVAARDRELLAEARMTSAELEAVLAEADEPIIAARIDELRARVSELTTQLATLDAARGEQERVLGALTTERAQAEARARQQDARATLERLVPEYRRLMLQEALLQSMLEQAAQRERGPLVERASRYFEQLTGGEWRRLVTGIDDDGTQQAQVERASDGALVDIASLSEGTRDQLFLALRLAVLVDGAARGESMPLVVDDILLTFDDARAAATMQLLAEISAHMQVIFLTHHEHLVDLATRTIDADVLRMHRLDDLVAAPVS